MKRSWKRIALVLILPALGILSLWLLQPTSLGGPTDPRGPIDKPGTQEATSVWMKEKLGLSQNVFAGLTKGDFDAILRNAKALDFANRLEAWSRASDPEYARQVRFFNYANRSLIESARQKNLEATTVAYVQLTVSCVNCHAIVRDTVTK